MFGIYVSVAGGRIKSYTTGWTIWGVQFRRGELFFFSPGQRGRLWDPPILEWVPGFIPGDRAAGV